jgi:hypothetical protein
VGELGKPGHMLECTDAPFPIGHFPDCDYWRQNNDSQSDLSLKVGCNANQSFIQSSTLCVQDTCVFRMVHADLSLMERVGKERAKKIVLYPDVAHADEAKAKVRVQEGQIEGRVANGLFFYSNADGKITITDFASTRSKVCVAVHGMSRHNCQCGFPSCPS